MRPPQRFSIDRTNLSLAEARIINPTRFINIGRKKIFLTILDVTKLGVMWTIREGLGCKQREVDQSQKKSFQLKKKRKQRGDPGSRLLFHFFLYRT